MLAMIVNLRLPLAFGRHLLRIQQSTYLRHRCVGCMQQSAHRLNNSEGTVRRIVLLSWEVSAPMAQC